MPIRSLKIYLDTSVINFLFADDAPDFKKATIDFFENRIANFATFISDVVLLEISRTPEADKRNLLLGVIDRFSPAILRTKEDENVARLAGLYLAEGVIPRKKGDDALHIAVATVNEMDALVSWNFKHLANLHKQVAVNSINEREGFLKKLNLITPLEVDNEN